MIYNPCLGSVLRILRRKNKTNETNLSNFKLYLKILFLIRTLKFGTLFRCTLKDLEWGGQLLYILSGVGNFYILCVCVGGGGGYIVIGRGKEGEVRMSVV